MAPRGRGRGKVSAGPPARATRPAPVSSGPARSLPGKPTRAKKAKPAQVMARPQSARQELAQRFHGGDMPILVQRRPDPKKDQGREVAKEFGAPGKIPPAKPKPAEAGGFQAIPPTTASPALSDTINLHDKPLEAEFQADQGGLAQDLALSESDSEQPESRGQTISASGTGARSGKESNSGGTKIQQSSDQSTSESSSESSSTTDSGWRARDRDPNGLGANLTANNEKSISSKNASISANKGRSETIKQLEIPSNNINGLIWNPFESSTRTARNGLAEGPIDLSRPSRSNSTSDPEPKRSSQGSLGRSSGAAGPIGYQNIPKAKMAANDPRLYESDQPQVGSGGPQANVSGGAFQSPPALPPVLESRDSSGRVSNRNELKGSLERNQNAVQPHGGQVGQPLRGHGGVNDGLRREIQANNGNIIQLQPNSRNGFHSSNIERTDKEPVHLCPGTEQHPNGSECQCNDTPYAPGDHQSGLRNGAPLWNPIRPEEGLNSMELSRHNGNQMSVYQNDRSGFIPERQQQEGLEASKRPQQPPPVMEPRAISSESESNTSGLDSRGRKLKRLERKPRGGQRGSVHRLDHGRNPERKASRAISGGRDPGFGYPEAKARGQGNNHKCDHCHGNECHGRPGTVASTSTSASTSSSFHGINANVCYPEQCLGGCSEHPSEHSGRQKGRGRNFQAERCVEHKTQCSCRKLGNVPINSTDSVRNQHGNFTDIRNSHDSDLVFTSMDKDLASAIPSDKPVTITRFRDKYGSPVPSKYILRSNICGASTSAIQQLQCWRFLCRANGPATFGNEAKRGQRSKRRGTKRSHP